MQLIFRNRWLALMWVAVSVISIGAYFREGGGHEQVGQASAQIRAQQAALQQDDGGHSFEIEAGSDGFATDEELIDTADPDAEKAVKPVAAQQPEEIADTYVLVNDSPVAPASAPAIQP